MNRKLIRTIATAVLAGVLAVSAAVPAQCAIVTGTTPLYSVNNGSELGVDIGNVPPRRVNVGGDVISVQGVDNNFPCSTWNQYIATGTNATGHMLPYTKFSTAGPIVRQALTDAAKSLGFVPGNAFEIEIGQFTNYAGYNVCSKLNCPMNFEVYAYPPAGYVPMMMALLPNGAITVLDDSEFDKSRSNLYVTNIAQAYYIHTRFPKAVYMMVYVPMK